MRVFLIENIIAVSLVFIKSKSSVTFKTSSWFIIGKQIVFKVRSFSIILEIELSAINCSTIMSMSLQVILRSIVVRFVIYVTFIVSADGVILQVFLVLDDPTVFDISGVLIANGLSAFSVHINTKSCFAVLTVSSIG